MTHREPDWMRRDFLKAAAAVGGASVAGLWSGPRVAAAAPAGPGGGSLPESYLHWQAAARRLIEPLAALMVPGRADLPILGQASVYGGPQADRLESLVRPLVLAAHWLQSFKRDEDSALRERISSWFRAALLIGTDPKNPQYFGPDANYHQHHVEIGLLCIGFQLAPEDLWDPLTSPQKDQIARWIGTARGNGIVNNNHYFMAVHILEFLGAKGYGRPADRPIVDEFLTRLEFLHRGGGWFEDGVNQAYDHYNAFAFHFYGLMWCRLYGARDQVRAQRWRAWARTFVRDYQHFFAASGEHPAFGRSMTYRFNTINVFGMALAEDCCDLSPGMLRRLCTRNLDFFLSKPITQSQGCLSLGWTDEFPPLVELYSCAASPYWAAKGFAALLLPPAHPFWTSPEESLPSERGDHAHVIPPAGLVVRSVGGAVEILNAGSQVAVGNLRYGAWKWSKTAYRTGTSFTLAFPADTSWSHDSALTLHLPDGSIYGRHSTVAVEMDERHIYYSTNFGGRNNQVNVSIEAGVWWKAGWLLQLHVFEARQPGLLRLGGYVLPLMDTQVKLEGEGGARLAAWSPEGRGTVLQPLHGISKLDWERRLDTSTPRTHIASPFHVTPLGSTSPFEGPGWIAALTWTGGNRDEARAWTVVSGRAGAWRLDHPSLGSWAIDHWALPALGATRT
jgi:hypothetical protein